MKTASLFNLFALLATSQSVASIDLFDKVKKHFNTDRASETFFGASKRLENPKDSQNSVQKLASKSQLISKLSHFYPKLLKANSENSSPRLSTSTDSRELIVNCHLEEGLSKAKSVDDLIALEEKCHTEYKKMLKSSRKGPRSVQTGWVEVNTHILAVYVKLEDSSLANNRKTVNASRPDLYSKCTYQRNIQDAKTVEELNGHRNYCLQTYYSLSTQTPSLNGEFDASWTKFLDMLKPLYAQATQNSKTKSKIHQGNIFNKLASSLNKHF